ncbi:MAG TPA: MmcQ/YjbR family DNA-binding protein [Acidimicrobiia bacterium]|nr:MmcQ/YjbR family DNA-binding protein [Acidimicrobiia bacterium]
MRPLTIGDVRREALALPRAYEAVVGGRIKYRVGRIVFLAASRDETLLGFGFPKEEREALVGSEPDKFMMPKPSDMRYNWAVVRLEAIDRQELAEIIFEAWSLVVPKTLATEVARQRGLPPDPR